ncbi:MAG: hypothetical protein SV422_12895, partial [Pseudomonadota bacterium]|nr:hypothetical protein [Pseudomonadota bacterium]
MTAISQTLTQAFMLNYPLGAARKLEAMSPAEAAGILGEQKVHVTARVLERLVPRMTLAILLQMDDASAAELLESIDVALAVSLLAQVDNDKRAIWLGRMSKATADEFRTLLEYPEDSVGQLMNPAIFAFNKGTSVGEALAQLRHQRVHSLPHLFLLNDDMTLHSRVDVRRLVLADASVP